MSEFIPSQIRTGMGNYELNNLEREEIEINVTSMVMTFMSYAMKTSAMYVEHSKRKVITVKDIKRAMMLEVFLYFNREDLEETVTEWRRDIIQDLQAQDLQAQVETEDETEDETEEETDTCISDEEKCDCDLCQRINGIDEYWQTYNPTDPLGKILKEHIDQMQL
jgi:hypothetical protein